MQTFLPFPDFEKSLMILDFKRLGKQRVEAFQILQILVNKKENRWKNHPAVLMWKNYERWLILYYNTCLKIFEKRGGNNIKLKTWVNYSKTEIQTKPWWLENTNFHKAHQSNLLRKKFDYYHNKFPKNIPIDLPYLWPNNENHSFKIINKGKGK